MDIVLRSLVIETLLEVIGPELIEEVFESYHLPYDEEDTLEDLQSQMRYYVYEGIIPEHVLLFSL